MSLGARLLASGALGTASGVAVAVGLVVMLGLPGHAQTLRASDHSGPFAPSYSVAQAEKSKSVDAAARVVNGDVLLGGRPAIRTISISVAADVGQGETDKDVTNAVPGASRARVIATNTRPGTEALVLNGSLT
jgi:hypothetical protein